MRVRVRSNASAPPRRGIVIIMTAFLLIFLFGLVAFAVDIGYLQVVEAELQASADSAALAATAQLLDENALKGLDVNQTQAEQAARQEAVLLASMNSAGGKSLFLPSQGDDLELGYIADARNPDGMRAPNRDNGELFNAVRVLLRRDTVQNEPVNLFFAPVMGKDQHSLVTEATAIYEMGISGFQVKDDKTTSKLFPFTIKRSFWEKLVDPDAPWDSSVDGPVPEFDDEYRYEKSTGEVVSGSDGLFEIKLFPALGQGPGKSGYVPGNFGTVNLGASNNSTNDLRRVIREGPNASDLSHFPDNTIKLGPDGTLLLNGNTGISAGMSHALDDVIGQERVLPLYTEVNGSGNNAMFTIVAFVGIRVLDYNLTGSNTNKHITVQPEWVVDGSAISGGDASTSMFITKPLALVR